MQEFSPHSYSVAPYARLELNCLCETKIIVFSFFLFCLLNGRILKTIQSITKLSHEQHQKKNCTLIETKRKINNFA